MTTVINFIDIRNELIYNDSYTYVNGSVVIDFVNYHGLMWNINLKYSRKISIITIDFYGKTLNEFYYEIKEIFNNDSSMFFVGGFE